MWRREFLPLRASSHWGTVGCGGRAGLVLGLPHPMQEELVAGHRWGHRDPNFMLALWSHSAAGALGRMLALCVWLSEHLSV